MHKLVEELEECQKTNSQGMNSFRMKGLQEIQGNQTHTLQLV